ncbi:MAG: hypothetical protein ACK4J0_01280 [Candidatus Anstonellaceae archaeon]
MEDKKLSGEKLLQYAVIFIIGIFIFSSLTIYFSGNNPTNTKTSENFEGYAQATAVLSSYETQLTVFNTNSEVLKLVKELSKEGKIVRNIDLPNNKIIIDLKRMEDVYKIANKITALGAEPSAEAYLDLKNITFNLANGEIRKIEDKRIKQTIKPIFDIGEEFEVQMYAILQKPKNQNEELYVLDLNLKNQSSQEKEFALSPKNKEVLSRSLFLEIPWEERERAKNFERLDLDFKYNKKINDYVFFSSTPPSDILTQIAGEKPEYVIMIRQNGIETKDDFNNKTQIEDFFAKYNVSLIFPSSTIEFEDITEEKINKVKERYVKEYPNSKTEFKINYKIKITFDETFEYEGYNYSFNDEELTKTIVKTSFEPQKIEKIILKAEVNKQKIKNYTIEEIKSME